MNSTFLALSLTFLAACNSDTEDTGDQPDPEVGTASLRVLHLSGDAPAVDVFVGADLAVNGLEFQEGSPYLDVEAGMVDLAISAAGTPREDAVLEVAGLELAEDGAYTAVAFDSVSNLKALVIEEELDGLTDGSIRVRAVHTVPTVGLVDIWEISDPMNPVPLFVDLDFGEASDVLDVPAGSYVLGVDVNDDAAPDLSFTLPALPAGTVANVYASVDEKGTVHLLAQLQDGTLSRIDADPVEVPSTSVRVLHLSPDAGAVDVWANGSPALSGVGFGQGSGWIDLDAGDWAFDVVPAGGTLDDAVLTVDLSLASDTFTTAVAFGEVADLRGLALDEDDRDLGEGDIRVRAIHAAAIVGEVDIWEVSDPDSPIALYEDMGFGAVGGSLDLPADAYSLGFDLDDDASPDVIFDVPELPAGTVANVFAVADADDVVHLQAQLWDGSLVRIDAR